MEKDLLNCQKPNRADDTTNIQIEKLFLPITINKSNISTVFSSTDFKKVLAIVIGTKPDFYKQAPLLLEAKREKLPSC
ncbi:MAG: hypothetical protein ACTHKK_10260, partial [Candidatus Nitrosocosmicus sp.]